LATRTRAQDPLESSGPSGGTGTSAAPTVIEARGIAKRFRIPERRITTFKERAVRPFARPEFRELDALRGISFDIGRGEFFGIVGRNGSGKSTLLKILASIYRADAGSIRMAGRLAPFIELGVGFNPEFTARENIVLNGVMMGLSRREARRSVDAVLDFAELREFEELKLKNYSSGMMVRLAFSVMIQADADILLIDEVLAVGDAAFAQKCADVFHDLRDGPKTVLLVTHDMLTVEEYCHRAMLIDDGHIRHIGDPEEVGRRYLKLNFDQGEGRTEPAYVEQTGNEDARLVRAWLENPAGQEITNLEQGQPIRFRADVEAQREIIEPSFGWVIRNADDVHICGYGTHLEGEDGPADRMVPGERAQIAATMENPLTPGRHRIAFWVCRNRRLADVVVSIPEAVTFVIYGSVWTPGVVTIPAKIEAVPERREGGTG
jgi:ABC-type polysaccharide/polyol phosphate transport system ATPase subunit